MPERDAIIEALENAGRPTGFKSLVAALGVKGNPARHAFQRRLQAMIRDGQLIQNRREEYCLPEKVHLVIGRVQGHPDGFGFLIPDSGGDDVYLSARQMREVIHGDRLAVRIKGYDRRGRPEGTIAEVLQRASTEIVGRYLRERGVGFVIPDNPRITHQIIVPDKRAGQARQGQLVLVEIVSQPSAVAQPVGKVTEVLGEPDAPGIETELAIYSHGLPHRWPKAVQLETEAFGPRVPVSAKKDRVDLRDLPLVTIDGEDAKDFDDAVYAEPTRNGWRLLVAIADVSHYVRRETELDNEAQERGTSVYFPNRVVPMLPEVLSNGLCSLKPRVDRLCMVCEMQVSREGKVTRSKFFSAVMNSAARLTYTDVAAMLVDGDRGLRRRHQKLLPSLQHLYEVYGALAMARRRRGAIDFDIPEAQLIFDEGGRIADIQTRSRNDAHRLIEECMIAANVQAARFLAHHRIPTLYRVHDGPDEERIAAAREFLGGLGLTLGGLDKLEPKHISALFETVRGRPDEELIETVMLRAMAQAEYRPENNGHFGLALDAYAHFTSPIRRYPDLLVHRGIRHVLESGRSGDFAYSPGHMQELGQICSAAERRADDATREAVQWLKIEFMQDKLGEEFDGIITGVTDFGVFVTLKGMQIDGLVHVTSLGNDYFDHDRTRHRMVGQRSGVTYGLTDEMRVRVARASLEDRKIDFVPAGPESGNGSRRRGRRRPDGRRRR
ncbi:MAG: ribonuclease R [Gammaproteobacteria bacterium]